MAKVLRIFGLACLVFAGTAQAHSEGDLVVVPGESAVACLSRNGDTALPTYPEREAVLQHGGTVRIRLTFVGPDSAPKVELTYRSGVAAFDDSAVAFANSYRLPCMAAKAAPVIAAQEFQFVPGDGRKVISSDLRDDPKLEEKVRCITGRNKVPDYPRSAFTPPPEGTVLARMKFVDAVSEPEITVLFNGGDPRLAAAVLPVLQQYRAPCLTAGSTPFIAQQLFTFRRSTTTQYGLKDVTFKQFVGGVTRLDKHSARFDFSTMGCPFDVRLRLLQPHAPNQVDEFEQADPNRREFLEWLKQLSLNLPSDAARQVVGQSLTVSVPCGVFDLT
jgi:hypothetical protein